MINTSRLLRRHIFSIMVFGLALNRAPDAAPEAVIGNVLEGIEAFVGGADQSDDITMLCLRYNGLQKE